ncbi:guanylate-binding protein 2-like [Macrotis lagotis]|uniref:guanylate-binding protein 2-like n=1 Tax=Macrotis lagotis TaxID=92651 RepID=UPI003D69F4EA
MVQSHTKGIWMCCVPHPKKPNHTVILLDIDGLSNMEEDDNKNDSWLFALAVLLSSTFVYNSMSTINQQAMEQLQYPSAECIQSKSALNPDKVENISEFPNIFPNFRGIMQYLISKLKFNTSGKPVKMPAPLCLIENSKGQLIVNQKALEILSSITNPVVVVVAIVGLYQTGKSYLMNKLAGKKSDICNQPSNGVYGFSFGSTVQSHTKGIWMWCVPHPKKPNHTLVLLDTEGLGDVEKVNLRKLKYLMNLVSLSASCSLTHYEDMMKQRVQFPTETLTELLDMHATCEKEAIEIFQKDSFEDVDQEFQKLLMSQLEAKPLAFYKQNMIESEKKCRALIQDIFSLLEEAVNNGTFFKPGGYGLFLQMIKELKEKYHQQPRKGIQVKH